MARRPPQTPRQNPLATNPPATRNRKRPPTKARPKTPPPNPIKTPPQNPRNRIRVTSQRPTNLRPASLPRLPPPRRHPKRTRGRPRRDSWNQKIVLLVRAKSTDHVISPLADRVN